MNYSHRNGETEPPEVEGVYFVYLPNGVNTAISNMLFVEYDKDEDGFGYGWRFWQFGREFAIDLDEANELMQWWGPVTLPWEEIERVSD